jgi:hypothetical protein
MSPRPNEKGDVMDSLQSGSGKCKRCGKWNGAHATLPGQSTDHLCHCVVPVEPQCNGVLIQLMPDGEGRYRRVVSIWCKDERMMPILEQEAEWQIRYAKQFAAAPDLVVPQDSQSAK